MKTALEAPPASHSKKTLILLVALLLAAALFSGWWFKTRFAAATEVVIGGLTHVPDPPAPGKNEIAVTVADEKGRRIEDLKVELDVFMPGMSHAFTGVAKPLGNGRYGGILSLKMTGNWIIKFRVIDEKYKGERTFPLPVRFKKS